MPDDVRPSPGGEIAVTLAPDVRDRLERVAKALGRPIEEVVGRAVELYLDDEGADAIDVAEGLAELDRGESFSAEEAMGQLRRTIGRRY